MTKFTTYVVGSQDPLPLHPNWDHHRKLMGIHSSLCHTHGLAICTGCEFYLRWPLRDDGIDYLNRVAYMHMFYVHCDAVAEGRACIDVDLVDHGDAYLHERMRMIRKA